MKGKHKKHGNGNLQERKEEERKTKKNEMSKKNINQT